MIATDFTPAGVFICLAVGVGILIYAVSKGVKIDDGNQGSAGWGVERNGDRLDSWRASHRFGIQK
jgi:hypothetical protein